MSEEDLERYCTLINDARGDIEEIKKIIQIIWEDAKDDILSKEDNPNG